MFHFTIAEIPFYIDLPGPYGAAGDVLPLLRDFQGGTGNVLPTKVHILRGNPHDVPKGKLLFDPGRKWPLVSLKWDPLTGEEIRVAPENGGIWQVYERSDGEEGAHAFVDYSPHFSLSASLLADRKWRSVTVTENNEKPVSLFANGLGDLTLRTRIISEKGLVFHAAGICDRGHGILFVGHSGAGKSTQCEIWEKYGNAIPMNDDHMALRLLSDGPFIYGLPWGGVMEIARNLKAPLAGICVLKQASENRITRLFPKQSLPLLLPRVFLPYWQPELLELALSTIEEIVSATPVCLLECRPEGEIIPLVRDFLCI
jgi:hypothetical protein